MVDLNTNGLPYSAATSRMKILAISGSLRAASLNTALLRAIVLLAPEDISIELFTDLGNLPLFNPDLVSTAPPVVAGFRAQLLAADAVMIASPEYAHGVTGAMKNALDWMVGCEAFVNKPVALLNASSRAIHAQASLKETLTVMSARLIEDASITVPILGSHLDLAGIVSSPRIAIVLGEMLVALQSAVVLFRAEEPLAML